MFRTKSLSAREMSSLMEKHQTSGMKKENRYGSLRSLIADKTVQYHRHMKKLVLHENNLTYSSKKSGQKSSSKKKHHTSSDYPDKPSIK